MKKTVIQYLIATLFILVMLGIFVPTMDDYLKKPKPNETLVFTNQMPDAKPSKYTRKTNLKATSKVIPLGTPKCFQKNEKPDP